MTFIIVILGYSSLVTGVSVLGSAMLGMLLIRRRYVWRAFLGQIIAILLVTLFPYFGITLPNLRQMSAITLPPSIHSYMTYSDMTIMKNEALNWEGVNYLRQSSNVLWRSTHMYMSLPKAIFIIYMFRTLLVVLDDSRKETLQHANQDELTQLKNRRYGLMQMKQALMTIEEPQDISVILLDLDWFKEVNDNYGHDVGDQVLITVAQTLSQSLTDDIIVSRYGGEEFLIVLPDKSHASAMVIAEQLRQSIEKNVITVDDQTTFTITASLGVYSLTYKECASLKKANRAAGKTETGCELDKSQPTECYTESTFDSQTEFTQLSQDICQLLIGTADKALYEAKHRGRNQVVSANEMRAAGDHRINSLYGT